MKKIINLLITTFVLSTSMAFAVAPAETAKYFNGPTVTNISTNSMDVSLSQNVLNDLTQDEKERVYFEYFETQQVCIMIYPTPENCLPKKTTKGQTQATLNSLKPNTEYTVSYKIDGNIVCIKAPCPTGEFTSLSVTAKTKSDVPVQISRSLYFGTRGEDVKVLQNRLLTLGYLNADVKATGYFGFSTLKAVREFQKTNMKILPIGIVGPKTRDALFGNSTQGVTFSGKLEAVSTACFADGICSVKVDGKVVVTTIGWSQQVVGSVKGVEGFGDLQNHIGKTIKVYAKKTTDGYTLYGSSDYYVELVK